MPAAAITATWVHAAGASNATHAAAAIIVTRRASGHRLRAMPHTACAITATDTIFRPCSAPAASGASMP